MTIILNVPEDIARHLASQGQDVSRAVLELMVLEAYREHKLTIGQLRRVLGFHTRMHAHALLKAHNVPLHYDQADLEHDRSAGDLLSAA